MYRFIFFFLQKDPVDLKRLYICMIKLGLITGNTGILINIFDTIHYVGIRK